MANRKIDAIIRENAPRLRSYVRSRVGNSDDADDIVQDTFYQLLRTLSIVENPIGQVTSWLYTVAHNLIINHGKKHREFLFTKTANDDDSYMIDLTEVMVASDSEAPDMLVLRRMVWQELEKAIAELPPEQRQAVEMTEIQGLSTREAAAKMGVATATFLSRKHYAVVHIRKRLKALYEELTQL